MSDDAKRAPANRAEVVALIAEAIAGGPQYSVEVVASWLEDAESVLAALEAAGVRLVPVEMTGTMTVAACRSGLSQWQWDKTLAASPYAPEADDE